jgi:hemerythrin-like domain-containing protein
MCDYCGCRRSGPTAELNAEHERLAELSEQLRLALASRQGVEEAFTEFVQLLTIHAAKEEVGLFPHAHDIGVLAESIETLIDEHEQLHRLLADGPTGPGVIAALKLLSQHIDDEEYDLFPHVFHALDPEQWEEIALAHLAVIEAFTPVGAPR